MTRPSTCRPGRVGFTFAAALGALAAVGCGPLEYCTPPACSLTPDGGVDAGLDASDDAGSDAGSDGGPARIAIPFDGTTLPTQVCSLDGWCWLSPHGPPDGQWEDVASVSGTSEAWVVTRSLDGAAAAGAILHYDGTTWRGLVGLGARRVAAGAAGHVWFLSGDSHVFAWNGTNFLTGDQIDAPGVVINDLAATATGDAWVVGDGGVVLHWDTLAWRGTPTVPGVDFGVPATTNLRAVYAPGPDDVWVAGAGGVVRHAQRTGMDWVVTPVDAPAGFDVEAIWAAPDSSSAWIGGPTGALYRSAASTSWVALAASGGEVPANIVAIAGTQDELVYLLSRDGPDFRAPVGGLGVLTPDHVGCEARSVAAFGTGYQFLRVGGRTTPSSTPCPITLQDLRMAGTVPSSPLDGPFGSVGSVEPLTSGDDSGSLLVYAADGARVFDPVAAPGAVDMTLAPPDATTPLAPDLVVEASHGSGELWVDTHDGSAWHRAGGAWARVVVASSGVTDLLFATDGEATWVAAGPQLFAWDAATSTLVPWSFARADDIEQLAAGGGVVWALHGHATSLTRYLSATAADEHIVTMPQTDCAPLVARADGMTVECLAADGRWRYVVTDATPTVAPVAVPIEPADAGVLFTSVQARALAGDHGWIFGLDGAAADDERILWPVAGDAWERRTSGIPGGGLVRMLPDGTTWRVIDSSLLEWRQR